MRRPRLGRWTSPIAHRIKKRSMRQQGAMERFAGGRRRYAKLDGQGLAQALKRTQTVGPSAQSQVAAHYPLIEIFGQIVDLQPFRIPAQRGIPVLPRFAATACGRHELDKLGPNALTAGYRPRGVDVRIEEIPVVK